MGITGLIPFLEKSSKKTNISEFSGKTVAVDTYCWLHKGAFFCADKILMGQETNAYVKYCMKFVNMLLGHNIKPILVFDGRHLPAKAETEVKRRESRNANRKRAAELIKMGKISEGKSLLRRSLDVSHKMALEVMKECQAHNIDCIVAPYEADAQLAYLNISGVADVVITEDSDLTLFGCKKIFFKMDMYGYGVLVEQDRLHLAMGLKLPDFTMDKFQHMCILSGCDYLASLPGIGLNKACKFIVKNTDENIYNALLRLASSLNMKSLVVTNEYRDGFMRALATFKHQLVYCPLKRQQIRLNPPTPDITEEQLKHAGSEVDEQLAWHLALGNCDPFTKEMLHNFDPDKPRLRRTNSWSETAMAKHESIWSPLFKRKKQMVTPKKEKQLAVKTPSTRGKVVVMKTDSLKKEITPRKRTFEESDMDVDELVQMYKDDAKLPATPVQVTRTKTESEVISTDDEKTSPILVKRSNPFKKINNSTEISPSLVHKIRKRLPIKGRLRATVIDDTAVAQSEFFAPEPSSKIINNEPMDATESVTTHVNYKEACKENVNISVKTVIIPETEDYEDDLSQLEERDKESECKSSSVEREINVSAMSCDDSVNDKEPLHLMDNNTMQNIDSLKVEFDEESANFENSAHRTISDEDGMDFTITSQVFAETRSSMFKYENPISDKRLTRNNAKAMQSNQRLSQSSQGSKSRRNVKTNSKKTAIIQGQRSLLNMFGFQKKNALQH